MREILFRGQCCTDGKWVEGYLGIEELVEQVDTFSEFHNMILGWLKNRTGGEN